jgi:hypothetical protein
MRVEIELIVFNLEIIEVSGQLHAPAALFPKEADHGNHYIRHRLGTKPNLRAIVN